MSLPYIETKQRRGSGKKVTEVTRVPFVRGNRVMDVKMKADVTSETSYFRSTQIKADNLPCTSTHPRKYLLALANKTDVVYSPGIRLLRRNLCLH
jgi:hypothetical protein